MTFARLFNVHHEFGSRRLRKSCSWRWDQVGPLYVYDGLDNKVGVLEAHVNEIWTELGVSRAGLGGNFGNSSHFYLPLIDTLPTMHANVKVVYLIRDAFEYCRSMIARGLERKRGWIYNPSPRDRETYVEWGSWDRLRRAAWIWAFQNKLAHGQLLQLPKGSCKVVWTHDIYPRAAEISKFIGCHLDAKMVAGQRVVNKTGDGPVRRNVPYAMPPPGEWEDADREKVLPYAKEIAQLPLFERK